MRLNRISIGRLTAFRDEASLNLSDYGPGLVALVGDNGAGKTSLMETAVASLYRFLPSRPGSIYDYATDRHALLESVWGDSGHTLTAKVLLDAHSRTQDAVLSVDGRTTAGPKAGEFDTAIDEIFGPSSLFLASVFACQTKSGNFLMLTKAERKDLFVSLLGLGHLQAMSERARDARQRYEGQITTSRRVIAELLEGAEKADALRAEIDALAAGVETDRASLAEWEARLAETQKIVQSGREAAARLEGLQSANAAALRELQSARKAVAEAIDLGPYAERQAEDRRSVLPNPDEFLGLALRRKTEALSKINSRRADLLALTRDVPDFDFFRADLAKDEKTFSAIQSMRHALELAVAEERRMADAIYQHNRAWMQREKQREAMLAGLAQRAALIDRVPCSGQTQLVNGCPLLADARKGAEEHARLLTTKTPDPERESLQAALDEAQEKASAIRFNLGDEPERRMAWLSSKINQAKTKLALEPQIAAARSELDRLTIDEQAILENFAADERATEQMRAERETREMAINAELSAALLVAQQRLREAEQAALDAQDRAKLAADALTVAAGECDPAALREANSRLDAAKSMIDSINRGLASRGQEIARIEAQFEAAQDKQRRAEGAQSELDRFILEAADWQLLESAFGRDGIQALEIDAAGPEVAALTNDLLAACYGTRFSISFETLREKKSGGYAEAFDVQVLDAGQARPVEALSGGEKVIIGEAVGLALAIFNARKSGVKYETLFRDETAGALDPENARAYVQMLRRARDLGGFHQVIFVAHQPAVWEAADVQVYVGDGRVSLSPARKTA